MLKDLFRLMWMSACVGILTVASFHYLKLMFTANDAGLAALSVAVFAGYGSLITMLMWGITATFVNIATRRE